MREGLRDAKLQLLKNLRSESLDESSPAHDTYESLVSELKAEWPGHMPLLMELLQRLDGQEKSKRGQPETLTKVIAAADDGIAAVDQSKLAAFMAIRPPDDEQAVVSSPALLGGSSNQGAGGDDEMTYKELKSVMDERKSSLLEAYAKKVGALLDLAEVRDLFMLAGVTVYMMSCKSRLSANDGGGGKHIQMYASVGLVMHVVSVGICSLLGH